MIIPAQSSDGTKKIFFFILTTVAVGFLAISANNQVNPRSNRLITTTGVGTKKTQAQKAHITFVLTVDATDRNGVLKNGEERFSELLLAVQAFNPTTINRTAYQIAPLTNNLTGETRGYRYANGAVVTIEGTQNIDNLINVLTQKEATVAQVRYIPQDEKVSNAEVRELAITDAREKAEQMAKASGAKLGKVVGITEQTANTGSGVTSQSAQQGSFTGQQEGSVNGFSEIELQSVVQITYELK